jgi:hypothetical protein
VPPDGAFQLGGKGVRFEDITDGLSNTILVGEKHIPVGYLGQGSWDSSAYDGDHPRSFLRGGCLTLEHTVCREADSHGIAISLNDPGWKFGSYHPAVCLFVFSDGSVQALSKTISADTFRRLTSRNDGQVVGDW